LTEPGKVSLCCPACRATLRWAPGNVECHGCGSVYPDREGVLELVKGRVGGPAFDPHYFGSLARVEDRHFWFLGRRRVILDTLVRGVPDLSTRPLFDIGCGSGGLLHFLGRSGVALGGACDAYVESLHLVRRRLDIPLVQVDEGRVPPLGPGQRLLGLFDVLEHQDHDREWLSSLHGALEPGGYLVLTVPAHPFLFDEMDEIACHRRRYRRQELAAKLREAGFEIVSLTHFMAALVPALMAVRALGRLLGRRHNAHQRRQIEFRTVPVVNSFLLGVLALERAWLRVGTLPFGSSLIALVRRA
jgi:2-polyprenyl-3-methyl-5-hydroxy-6-metoxy-1,4-benzoquinol methylase